MNIRVVAFMLFGAAGSVYASDARPEPFPGSVAAPTAPSPHVAPTGAASLPIYPTASSLKVLTQQEPAVPPLRCRRFLRGNRGLLQDTAQERAWCSSRRRPCTSSTWAAAMKPDGTAERVIKDYTWNNAEGYHTSWHHARSLQDDHSDRARSGPLSVRRVLRNSSLCRQANSRALLPHPPLARRRNRESVA